MPPAMLYKLEQSITLTIPPLQSEIASERPGVFDCLWEGMTRTMAMTTQQTTRLLPVWQLLAPSALHGLLHYVIASLAQYTVVISIRTEIMENKVRPNHCQFREGLFCWNKDWCSMDYFIHIHSCDA